MYFSLTEAVKRNVILVTAHEKTINQIVFLFGRFFVTFPQQTEYIATVLEFRAVLSVRTHVAVLLSALRNLSGVQIYQCLSSDLDR